MSPINDIDDNATTVVDCVAVRTVHFKTPGDRSTLCRVGSARVPNTALSFTSEIARVTCNSCRIQFQRLRARETGAAASAVHDVSAPPDPAAGNGANRDSLAIPPTAAYEWTQPLRKTVHFKAFGWAATACRLTWQKYPALICSVDPRQVDCQTCLGFLEDVVGIRALDADALREIRDIRADLVTKQDIAELKASLERTFGDLVDSMRASMVSKHMDAKECARHLGRSVEAIYSLKKRGHIPYAKIGGKVQFDREKIDRWVQRHARRGSMV